MATPTTNTCLLLQDLRSNVSVASLPDVFLRVVLQRMEFPWIERKAAVVTLITGNIQSVLVVGGRIDALS